MASPQFAIVDAISRSTAATQSTSSESPMGEQFDAIVTGASAKGTWVRIHTPAAEGKVVRGFEGLDVPTRRGFGVDRKPRSLRPASRSSPR
jgi:hypothetical protein